MQIKVEEEPTQAAAPILIPPLGQPRSERRCLKGSNVLYLL